MSSETVTLELDAATAHAVLNATTYRKRASDNATAYWGGVADRLRQQIDDE